MKKRKTLRKGMARLLVFVMLFSIMPIMAFAEDDSGLGLLLETELLTDMPPPNDVYDGGDTCSPDQQELKTLDAEKISLPPGGGDSLIIVTGTNLVNGMKVAAFDSADLTDIAILTATTTGNASAQTVILTFPANTSTIADKVYTIRISLDDGMTWSSLQTTVTVEKAALLPLTIEGGISEIDYTYTDGVLTITKNGNYIIGMVDGITSTNHRIIVESGVNAEIKLNGVTIEGLGNEQSPILLNDGADVILILVNDTINTLTGGIMGAGIQTTGATLTIEGTGSLTAIGTSAAGIGGNRHGGSGGNLFIHGGTVRAQGGHGGAGIGGGPSNGDVPHPSGSGGNIVITGGNVTAIGGTNAAGIGSGGGTSAVPVNGNGGIVSISGGTVTAIATSGNSAAIGAGHRGNGGIVNISGGTVTASGGIIGIGGADSVTTISGGIITASGNFGAFSHAPTIDVDHEATWSYNLDGTQSLTGTPYTWDPSHLWVKVVINKPDEGTNQGGGSHGGRRPSVEPKPDIDKPSVDRVIPFIDVQEEDWFANAVMYVYNLGLMTGTSIEPMMFGPNMALTRGMAITVLYRHAGSPDVSGLAAPFNDVSANRWYTDAAIWAAANGIVKGIGDGKFAPYDSITKQDLAVILNNYAIFAGLQLPIIQDSTIFNDNANIANYATEAIENFFRAGIINGRPGNMLDPKGQTLRAEFATMFMNFLEATEQTKY